MIKKTWRLPLLGAGFLHLILVSLGAASVDLSEWGWIGGKLNYLCLFTGANNGFAFFAPGVESQIRAQFEIKDNQERSIPVTLQTSSSHEANLRIGNIVDQFLEQESDDPETLNRSLVASMAGKVFGLHPEAKRVKVNLENFVAVSMSDFRKGARPKWESVYSATFIHRNIQMSAKK